MFSLSDPIPPDPLSETVLRKNIVAKALKYYKYLTEDSSRSCLHISQHFGASLALVSQPIGLVNRLPKNFIDEMKDYKDHKILKRYSGRVLLKIVRSNRERELRRGFGGVSST